MANERVRIQVKTGVDPEVWSDVGVGSVGYPLPVQVESIDDIVNNNTHTGTKELRVFSSGHICSENSTNTPLDSNEVFTGDWQDTLDYSEVIVSVNSDKNSATNGLVINWSSNGVIVDETDEFTISANRGKTFSFPCNRKYVKITYTNGSIAQTIFDIQTSLKRFASKGSSHRISDSIVGEDDAALVKSVVTGLRDDGVFGNITLDNENRMAVNAQDYLYGIAENAISGHSSLLKFGTRTSIAAATQSTIWEGPTARYVYLSSAEQLKVSSSATTDTSNGTGARTVTLYGLDSNWNEISETVTMNGITAVTTVNSFIRIYRLIVATSGTSYTNDGNITVTNNAGTTTLVYVPAGDGQTLMAVWTVPAGKVAYMVQATTSSDTNKGARMSVYTRLNDGGTLYPWQIKYRAYQFGGNEIFPFNIPFKIPAKTDIEIRITTPGSSGTTSAGATFELWYENA